MSPVLEDVNIVDMYLRTDKIGRNLLGNNDELALLTVAFAQCDKSPVSHVPKQPLHLVGDNMVLYLTSEAC